MNPRLCLAVAALATVPVAARAQTCTTPSSSNTNTRKCTVSVSGSSWVVNKLGVLTLSSAADISLASPGGSVYDAGYRIEDPSLSRTATIKANAPWNLTLAPSSATTCSFGVCWTGTDLATPYVSVNHDKAADNFLVATTYDLTGAAYLQLPDANTPSAGTTVLSAQPATAGTTVTLYWAEVWNYFSDTPGTYTLPFVVTLTIP